MEIRRVSVEVVHCGMIARVLSGVSQRPKQNFLDFDNTKASAGRRTFLPGMSIVKYFR